MEAFDVPKATWILASTGGGAAVAADFHALASEWQDIEGRELALGIPSGMPVLISDGCIDDRFNAYFREAFPRDRMTTARTYAEELRRWVGFLDSRDVRWDEAGRADVRSFQTWRVYSKANPSRVTPATWNKGWAALRHFYNWACREGWVERDPVGGHDRLRDPSEVGGYPEKNARGSRDRWLTPAEYRMWRDVGLRGYQAGKDERGMIAAGLPIDLFRGRNLARNAAFVDYVVSTGLRDEEAGSLLSMEIPMAVGDETPIVGKGGVFRRYRPTQWMGLDSVQAYRDGERRDVIKRAQRKGRYEKLHDRILINEVLRGGRRGQRIRVGGGRIVDVAMMTTRERRNLFAQGPDGLEPAALWLTEAGDPMPHTTWNSVFNAANDRVSAARGALGVESPWVHVTPHSLRFTFALFVLVAGVRATDKLSGRGPADPFLVRNYSHVFDEVRDLLGHASVETTRRIYLEPVKSLRRSAFFHGNTVDEMWDGIVRASPLIGFDGTE